ncbi:MAG: hypothetical protein ACKVOM_05120 [Ferruginibacter sp.]
MVTDAGLLATTPIASLVEKTDNTEIKEIACYDKQFAISIVQTTNVHCPAHPHDELFWENEKAVFPKTGGYAHLATYLQKERRGNANTFLIETGDTFQGSELSVKITGKAMDGTHLKCIGLRFRSSGQLGGYLDCRYIKSEFFFNNPANRR